MNVDYQYLLQNVPFLQNIKQVSAGFFYTLFLSLNGQIYATGLNDVIYFSKKVWTTWSRWLFK